MTAIFDVHTSKAEYRARKIVLATGYYDVPNMLNVPGEELDKVIHYYKEPHPYYNHDVLVVGAKNSAAIAALELYWTGARVTLIHRGSWISDRIKYWIKPNIENRIKNGEITGLLQFARGRNSSEDGGGGNAGRSSDVEERFCLRADRLSAGSGISGLARHPAGAGDAAAAHQSGDARKRPAGHFPRRRDRGRDAHQRDLHRKRPLPRQEDRRSHRASPLRRRN